jgi:nicotinamide phosphoribosyltransferase
MKINNYPASLIPTLHLTDGYKVGHVNQYPEGTEIVYSNLTPRGTRIDGILQIVWAGAQYLLKRYLIDELNTTFFNLPKEQAVGMYKRRIFNYTGPMDLSHIENLHDLGYLPLEIKSLPEGELVGMKVPVMTIRSTKPEFNWLKYWVTNYIETLLSCVTWQPSTSATIAANYNILLTKFALDTVGDASFVPWQGHDFSFRGMSSVESALTSGFGHLLSFTGTDTIAAIDFCENYYNADCKKELIGGSVPATEHAVMSANMGLKTGLSLRDNELEGYRRLITKVYPDKIVSIVSDTRNFWDVCRNFMTALKPEIMARDGKVVLRPDSGDPVKIITGYNEDEILRENGKAYELIKQDSHKLLYKKGKELSEDEIKGAIQTLWEVFGGTTTAKGYKLLDSHIGLIYGDSITLQRAKTILERLKVKGFASINVVLGIGSYTYQYNTRDTFGFAMKATWAQVKGVGIEIFKDPITDDGLKKSAKGLLQVKRDENGNLKLKDQCTWEEEQDSELKTVFLDGKLVKDWTLAEIRARVAANIKKAVEALA